ncbi:hypothetical protein A2483_02995 [Candidatus Peregrinibacteria bacterium RIFOXYC2_FULL_33_13]|nr:MAG: twitching motility protein PilT [Candidatus Peregrinibacteria bacterium GW2011_GWC2_33_13]OGJ54442.1 MAG: hypothetical protein A2483_02995 [Candidatus Peregrinibacteria bacterium RIFOXYC2_FULL_33_13]
MKYLFDTNIISYLDKVKYPRLTSKILKKAKKVGNKNIFISIISCGEILAGIKSNLKMNEDKRQNLIRIISNAYLLKMQRITAEIYADVKVMLYEKGVCICDNDLWIAAIALTYNATLVTNDNDFKKIKGLKIENWIR